ncbi:cytochrome P450 27C1 [Cyprinodon tularosa]|uniref:Cytochrome P450, family 27, subfamily C, polypeptide 1 n=1 Tax=Cyprinodon variegatus TaxID=28743 RepID=A0A3Q2FXH2_CYPVA|nr:PREDICTED: cytochrome P450 27C1-like [Cyprinodon variegatus]XP_038124007.1 cytochrome P450 27C1 [Cyprinodon tularosa]
MAVLNRISAACWRGMPAGLLNEQLFLVSRALHKTAASEALQIPTGEEAVSGRLIAPAELREKSQIKTLKEMPGPSTISNLVEFFWRDGFSRIHEIQMEHSKKYGKIFKSYFGPQLVVSIADRELVAEVLRAEGVAPQRANMESWQEYRDLRGRSTGLISAEGEEWLKMRSVLRQLIMRPRDVAVFSDDVNKVVDDLIKRVYTLRSQQPDGLTVLNVNDLFFKYSMEGVAAILYECRLGCLENDIPKATQDYISALHLMFSSFKTTMYAGAIPKWLRPIIPKPWEEFCLSWDGLFRFSMIHVDQRFKEIKAQVERGETVKGGLLTHMLTTMEMSVEEIYANVTEMLLAGVDTTSFTLSWASYLLARHPHIQEQIYTEVTQTLGSGTVPTAEDVPRLPLIRGLVKETLRLFPVLPGNGRITQDDLVVGGYFIPKGTQLALCHYSTSLDAENFPSPLEFQPERWVRKDSSDRVDNFGSIPFGYGIRSCIGRRIAELEMHLALTRLIQRFSIGVSPLTAEVKAKTHGLLCPAAPINLQFIERKN